MSTHIWVLDLVVELTFALCAIVAPTSPRWHVIVNRCLVECWFIGLRHLLPAKTSLQFKTIYVLGLQACITMHQRSWCDIGGVCFIVHDIRWEYGVKIFDSSYRNLWLPIGVQQPSKFSVASVFIFWKTTKTWFQKNIFFRWTGSPWQPILNLKQNFCVIWWISVDLPTLSKHSVMGEYTDTASLNTPNRWIHRSFHIGIWGAVYSPISYTALVLRTCKYSSAVRFVIKLQWVRVVVLHPVPGWVLCLLIWLHSFNIINNYSFCSGASIWRKWWNPFDRSQCYCILWWAIRCLFGNCSFLVMCYVPNVIFSGLHKTEIHNYCGC